MNKKRHILFGVTHGPLLQPDGHLTDAWLLLAMDGELAAAEYSLVQNHLHACWKCRAHKEHLERTIEDIVEYDRVLVAPDMPPSPSGRAMFMARLEQQAAELGSPSLMRPWVGMLSRTSRFLFSAQVAWVGATAFIIVACFYIVFRHNTPVVSASELLQRAAASETRSFNGVSQPVIIQKLSIKVNGRRIARTIYRDTAHKRQAQHIDVSAAEDRAVEEDFERSSLNWKDPLSPQVYSHWRDGILEKRDSVTLTGGLLKLDTTASTGPIAEASITVRADDYRPVAEDVRLRDKTQVEVAELSYQVVGLSTLDPDIFGAPAITEPLRLPAISASLPVHSVFPDPAELAASELRIRSALHSVGADLGEQIDVQPLATDSILVKGIVADEVRKRQLIATLQGIPLEQLRIETVAQAAAHQPASQTSGASPQVSVLAGSTPLLEAFLKQRFPDDDQRTAYVNQTLALTQEASARAWALDRLAERYNPQQMLLLDAASRQRLSALLGDHVAALREDVNRLQNQLGQVLSSASNTAAANTASSGPPSAKPVDHADDWRDHARRVHSSVETVNESVAALLTGSPENESDKPEAIEIGLRTTLTQLQAELQVLDQQIHKQF